MYVIYSRCLQRAGLLSGEVFSRISYRLFEIAIFLSCTSVLQILSPNLFTDVVSFQLPTGKKKRVLNCFGLPAHDEPTGHPAL